MEKQKLNYLMVLFGLVFMTMTTLPGFIPSVEFVAQLVGGITKVAGVALLVTGIVLNIGNWKGVMPIPFIVVAGVAALVTILSMIPFIGYVFTWIAFIVSIVAIFLAGGAFKVQWKNSVTAGAVVLALATTAAYYEVIDSILFVNFAAIAAYVFIFLNVAALNPVLDEAGQSAMGKLKIAAICGIVASVLKMIPVVSTFVAWLPYTAFAIFLLLAFKGLKESFPEANLLFITSILLLVEEGLDFIPFICYFVCPFIALGVLVVSVWGWYNVIAKLEK